MTMQHDARQMIGFHVITSDNEDLGTVERVYLDNRTQQPEFVSVKSGGLFGRKESLVPLQGSEIGADRVRVPFAKQKVKDAPEVGNTKDISPAEGARLYQHYGLGGTSVPAQQSGEADRMADQAGDRTDATADTADMKAATGADPRADADTDRRDDDSATGSGLGMPAAAGIGTAAAAGVGTAAVAGIASHHGADAKADTPETGTDMKSGTGVDTGTDMAAGIGTSARTDTDAAAGMRTGMDADAPSGMDTRMPGAPAAAMVGHTGLDDPAPASDRMAESLGDRTADASPGLGADAGTADDRLTSGDGAPGAEPMAFSAMHDTDASGDAPAASAGMATDGERTAAPDGMDAGRPADTGLTDDHGAESVSGADPTAESAGMAGAPEADHATDAGPSAEAEGDSGNGKGAALAAGGAGVALAAGGAGAAYAAHRAKSSGTEHPADAEHTPDTADAPESPEAKDAADNPVAADAQHAAETADITATADGPDAKHAAETADTTAKADGPGAEHAAEMPDTEKSPDGTTGTDTAAAPDAARADAPAVADAGHAEQSGAPRTVAIPQQGIRLIREPIAEGEQLTDADHAENVIIVYAERLVVSTVRVPVERVRVVKNPAEATDTASGEHAHDEHSDAPLEEATS